MVLHVDLSDLVDTETAIVRHAVALRLRRHGVEMLLTGASASARNTQVDQALVKAILRGRECFERPASGCARSFAEIAHAEGVTGRYVALVVPLAFLAPYFVASILAGAQPTDLTAWKLIKQIDLALDWAEQRALLGFES